jgi:Nif-specific regulatory protein
MPDTANIGQRNGGQNRSATREGGVDNSLPLITIYEISKILGSTLNLEKSIHDVLNILSSYLRMRRGVVTLRDENGALEVVAVAGMSLRRAQEGEERFPLSLAQQVMGTAMPVVIHSLADDPQFAAYASGADVMEDEVQSLICVPIKTIGKPFGTLSIERHRDGTNTFQFEHDVRFLTMVANLIGQSVSLEHKVAADRERLILEKARLEKAMPRSERSGRSDAVGLDNVIGHSDAMMKVSAQVRQVAPSRATVLLRGESGTGKELIAKAVHYLSPRADKPFVKVNCAALTETLLESELFGHERGAFTGATSDRKGRFEMATGGTLFLDEIGEVSPQFQAKLLRVLQEGELERVGGNKTIKVDVRLIAATNKDLEDAVAKGEFRADLYFRINVVPIFLPALRDRKEDVPLLAQFFLDKFNEENARGLRFSDGALEVMSCCKFPGNVRELENCVFRAATLAQNDVIQELGLSCHNDQCLSATLWARRGTGKPIGGLAPVTELDVPDTFGSAWAEPSRPRPREVVARSEAPPNSPAPPVAPHSDPVDPMDDAFGGPFGGDGVPGDVNDPSLSEKDRLILAMEKAGWVQAKAGRLLGLTPRQIGYALKKYDIPLKRM